MEFGSKPTPRNLLISAQFLHKELPIRIARRAIELDTLPYGLSQKPAVLKVLLYSFFFFSFNFNITTIPFLWNKQHSFDPFPLVFYSSYLLF